MRRLLLLCLVFFSLNYAKAQLVNGSIAPDWTLTDINGTTHNLYNYLDNGYTVFIDFSAVWCAPCWAYHNSGALEDLYNFRAISADAVVLSTCTAPFFIVL